MMAHLPAQAFWRQIIADFVQSDFQESTEHVAAYGIDMVVQRFSSE